MDLTLTETIIGGLFVILSVIIAAIITVFSKKTQPPKRIKKALFYAMIFNILTIIGLVIFIAVAGNLALSPDQKTIIKITYPFNGATVNQTDIAQGISQNIPVGTKLWVVVHVPNLGLYYPMTHPASILSNGNWSCSVVLGRPQDSGQFDIEVLTVNQAAESAFSNYLSDNIQLGMQQLPEGAVVYDVVVTNRQPIG